MLGAPPFSDLSILSTRSGCSGAPPPPMPTTVEVSRVDQSGCISISRLIVGTPEKLVTPSRSISSSARPASHLYMNTIRAPEMVAGWSRQLLAVTWNSGVGAMNTFCVRLGRLLVAAQIRHAGVGAHLCRRCRAHRRHEREVQQVVDRPAMGELGALREPGGAGRVEDAGIVVGIDVDRGQCRRCVAGIDHVLPACGVGGELSVVADRDDVQRTHHRRRVGVRRGSGRPGRHARRRR